MKHRSIIKACRTLLLMFILLLSLSLHASCASKKTLKIAVSNGMSSCVNSLQTAVSKYNNNNTKYTIKLSIIKNSTQINVYDYDGLIIPGGGDVHPKFYGESNTASRSIDTHLDQLEMNLIKKFANRKKPVLGICRGLQVINVCYGGSLYQNIYNHKSTNHSLKRITSTEMGKIYSKDVSVYSNHHQAIKKLAKGFTVTMKSYDGRIEGIENKTKKIYAVQWHPESMYRTSGSTVGKTILTFFFNKCAAVK